MKPESLVEQGKEVALHHADSESAECVQERAGWHDGWFVRSSHTNSQA